MRKLIYILTLFLSLLSLSLIAQQEAIYSQYMYNQLAINPAVAGSKSAISGILIHRNQWTGFKGAPTTQSFTVHTPIDYNQKNGVGLQVYNDLLGSLNSIAVLGSYAYKLQFPNSNLSFGLRGGMYNYSIRRDRLDYREDLDNQSLINFSPKTVPGFDFGTYYYSKKYYLGISWDNLNKPNLFSSDKMQYLGNQMERHFFLLGGYTFKLNDMIVITPSTFIKYVKHAPINADINTNVTFLKVFALGISYRTSRGVAFLTEFVSSKSIRIGYSYDMMLAKRNLTVKNPTSEFYIAYDFAKKVSTKTNSPRF